MLPLRPLETMTCEVFDEGMEVGRRGREEDVRRGVSNFVAQEGDYCAGSQSDESKQLRCWDVRIRLD